MGKSVKAVCVLVFADSARRYCLLDLTIKDKAFRLVGVYAPNKHAERTDLFWRIEPFLMKFRRGRIVLAGYWNDVPDPDIDRIRVRSGINNLDLKALILSISIRLKIPGRYCRLRLIGAARFRWCVLATSTES